MAAALLVLPAAAFSTMGTKWAAGPNAATLLTGHEGTPGSFTWSVMAPGLGFQGYESHVGNRTTEFGWLLGGPSRVEEIAVIDRVMRAWSSVCGLSVTGPLSDGGVDGGAAEAQGGHLADMRFGAVRDGYGYGNQVLGHAYPPGNESIYGAGGAIAGDIHMNTDMTFLDDPNHVYTGDRRFDFETVMLHEVGHSIGLGHTDVPGSVMKNEYLGAKRRLRPDDIAGVRHIYGPRPVRSGLELASPVFRLWWWRPSTRGPGGGGWGLRGETCYYLRPDSHP